jgi:hypothetical protein
MFPVIVLALLLKNSAVFNLNTNSYYIFRKPHYIRKYFSMRIFIFYTFHQLDIIFFINFRKKRIFL